MPDPPLFIQEDHEGTLHDGEMEQRRGNVATCPYSRLNRQPYK
jgi:hypothetical protein